MKGSQHKQPGAPKLYRYVITLEQPFWPRKLADELSFARGVFPHIVSITDLQNSSHVYGATYKVKH